MTTRAEEIAGDGPYMVALWPDDRPRARKRYTIKGPTPCDSWWHNFGEVRSRVDSLNAAHKQGQQDRWIPVSEERQPERNTMAIYWTPGLDGTIESGYPAIADEWRWEHHGLYATHYLDFSTPNPEQR